MNPLFVALLFLAGTLLWFLLSFLFKPLGRLFHRLWKDAYDEINEDDDDNK